MRQEDITLCAPISDFRPVEGAISCIPIGYGARCVRASMVASMRGGHMRASVTHQNPRDQTTARFGVASHTATLPLWADRTSTIVRPCDNAALFMDPGSTEGVRRHDAALLVSSGMQSTPEHSAAIDQLRSCLRADDRARLKGCHMRASVTCRDLPESTSAKTWYSFLFLNKSEQHQRPPHTLETCSVASIYAIDASSYLCWCVLSPVNALLHLADSSCPA